jgi:hypothetical protein
MFKATERKRVPTTGYTHVRQIEVIAGSQFPFVEGTVEVVGPDTIFINTGDERKDIPLEVVSGNAVNRLEPFKDSDGHTEIKLHWQPNGANS